MKRESKILVMVAAMLAVALSGCGPKKGTAILHNHVKAIGGFNKSILDSNLSRGRVDPAYLVIDVDQDIRLCTLGHSTITMSGRFMYRGQAGTFSAYLEEAHKIGTGIPMPGDNRTRCSRTAAKALALGIIKEVRKLEARQPLNQPQPVAPPPQPQPQPSHPAGAPGYQPSQPAVQPGVQPPPSSS